MISYLVLIVAILCLALIAYRMFKFDILSPTVLSCAAFGFSIILAAIGLSSWNDQKVLSPIVMVIYLLGLLAFFAGEIVARSISRKLNFSAKSNQSSNVYSTIALRPWVYVIAYVFTAATFVILVLEIKRVCTEMGYSGNSITNMLSFYRSKSQLFSSEAVAGGHEIAFVPKQMKKVVDCLFTVFIYIALRNYTANRSLCSKDFIMPLIAALMCTPCSFLGNGGRSMLMHMAVSAIASVAIIYLKCSGHDNVRRANRRLASTVMALAALIIVAFYFMVPLVGRSHGNSNIIEYTSFYLGTPIASFNKKLQSHHLASGLLGEKTFDGIYNSLNRYGVIEYTKPVAADWVRHGKFSSNVYSSLYSYYSDFGIAGVVICQFFFGLTISLLYLLATDGRHQYALIIYLYYFYVLVDQIRDEQFFALVSTTTIVYLGILFASYWILIRRKKSIVNDY